MASDACELRLKLQPGGVSDDTPSTETAQRPSGLQTCPRERCTGHGRTLWRSHEFCPWCRGSVVPYPKEGMLNV